MKIYNGVTFRDISRYKYSKIFGEYGENRDSKGKRISFEDGYCAHNPYDSEINGETSALVARTEGELISMYNNCADDI